MYPLLQDKRKWASRHTCSMTAQPFRHVCIGHIRDRAIVLIEICAHVLGSSMTHPCAHMCCHDFLVNVVYIFAGCDQILGKVSKHSCNHHLPFCLFWASSPDPFKRMLIAYRSIECYQPPHVPCSCRNTLEPKSAFHSSMSSA